MIDVTHRANADDVFTGRLCQHAGIDAVRHPSAELTIHDRDGVGVVLRLPCAWMTPEQMAAWLRSLAAEAEDLAARVELASVVAS